jgi:hypothetical protein
MIVASTVIDKAYRRFDRVRSEVIAAVASDAVLARFNDLAYGGVDAYTPQSDSFREYLFAWEECIVREVFPKPPARVLIGGAGGGREALALARMGYEVISFDPSKALITSLAARAPANLIAMEGAYEGMDALFPEGCQFDAAIAGWGSFSHLRNERTRIETLRSFARLTNGPILTSFFAVKQGASPRLRRLRRLLPRRSDRDPQDAFGVAVGFYHPVDEDEIRLLAKQAALGVVRMNFSERDTNCPHVVLERRSE